ncbi:magnesium/cobalt transporter CorA [Myxococcota bacterium]|nr:magnesium/cobalt transporter CorA [Myxococcota bacterium]
MHKKTQPAKGRGLGEQRRRPRTSRRAPISAPPGTLRCDPDAVASRLRVFTYDAEALTEVESLEAAPARRAGQICWARVVGLGCVETVRALGARFKLHALALEDVLNLGQRPKVEDYDDHLFIVSQIITDDGGAEQISLFVGEGFVLTFEERQSACFDAVERRLRKGRGRIRAAGADYLAYALLDAALDQLTPVADAHGARLEALEAEILRGRDDGIISALLNARQDLQWLRRLVVGLQDKLAALRREDLAIISSETRVYLRDSHDHAIRLVERVEHWREYGATLMDVHLAVAGQQLNAVMKVLTIIATVFIPLSFIAGVYGMNFDPDVSTLNMPETRWRWGYPFALSLMAITLALQLAFFWRRGWLGGSRARSRR